MIYKVLTPLVTAERPYTIGDEIEIADVNEAQRMIDAGIIERTAPAPRQETVETADLQPEGAETAVRARKVRK